MEYLYLALTVISNQNLKITRKDLKDNFEFLSQKSSKKDGLPPFLGVLIVLYFEQQKFKI